MAQRAILVEMQDGTATYDDLLAAPEGLRAELIDGELLLQSCPAVGHQVVMTRLVVELEIAQRRFRSGDGDGPDGWVLVAGLELWLGSPDPRTRVLVPDAVGWRRSRWPTQRTTHGLLVPPDWVCEVLSPSTARIDRLRKADVYLEAGVGHYWLVDPLARTVEVFAAVEADGRRVWALVATSDATAPVVLAPFEDVLDVAGWWDAL